MTTDSQKLIAEYARLGSEAAFRELVEGYLGLVYSTALRLVGGDTHLAEDVAQTVFIDLARLAKGFSPEVRLGGWLHRHTCFVAAKTLRGERRRQSRERQAVEMNAQPDHSTTRLSEVAPILDEAINQLGAADRAAVLLRFYERLDFRAIGQAMGINESAAQKRVSRALEKLHVRLKRQGVALSVAALSGALAGEVVTAAPVGLAAGIAGTALASAAARPAKAVALLKLMASTKLKTSAVAAVLAVSVLTPMFLQREAQARLAAQNETWRVQSNQLEALAADTRRLAARVAGGQSLPANSNSEFLQVLKLRGEVGLLRSQAQQATAAKPQTPSSPEDQIASLKKMYAARAAQLKEWMEANPSRKIPELKRMTDDDWVNAVATDKLQTDEDFALAARSLRANAQDEVLSLLFRALRKYGADNQGQFPASLAELQPYLASPIEDEILQRYEIVPTRSLVPELRPGGDWAITQTAPADAALDIRNAVGLTNLYRADDRITNRWSFVP